MKSPVKNEKKERCKLKQIMTKNKLNTDLLGNAIGMKEKPKKC